MSWLQFLVSLVKHRLRDVSEGKLKMDFLGVPIRHCLEKIFVLGAEIMRWGLGARQGARLTPSSPFTRAHWWTHVGFNRPPLNLKMSVDRLKTLYLECEAGCMRCPPSASPCLTWPIHFVLSLFCTLSENYFSTVTDWLTLTAVKIWTVVAVIPYKLLTFF